MDLISIKNRCSSLLPYTYGFFMCAFFLFPSAKSHNILFYSTVLAPALPLFGGQFSHLFKNNIPYRIISIFIIYCSFSVFWSPNSNFGSIFKIFRHALYPLIFISITIHIFETNPKNLKKIFTWLIVAAVITAVANIFLWYKDNPFPISRLRGWGRIENPIVIGCCYGMIAIITLTRMFKATARRDILIYMATTIIFFMFIILTQSRLALIALSIIFLVSVIIHLNRMAMIFLMAAVMSITLFLLLEPEIIQKYFRGTAHIRFYIWKQILYDSMNTPFFGHGILDKLSVVVDGRTYTTSHSIYIGTAFHFGIFGILMLTFVIISALKISFDYAKQSKDYLLFLLCIFGLVCSAGDFGVLIDHPNGPWLLFWLPISLSVSKYNETREFYYGTRP